MTKKWWVVAILRQDPFSGLAENGAFPSRNIIQMFNQLMIIPSFLVDGIMLVVIIHDISICTSHKHDDHSPKKKHKIPIKSPEYIKNSHKKPIKIP